MVGKYVDLTESYKSLIEAIRHAGIHTGCKVNIDFLDSEEIESKGTDHLAKYDAILVPGGFGKRGVEGKIATAQYAREHKVPYLGICLGMQVALIEFARHVAGLSNANSTEFDPDTDQPVVALITEWQKPQWANRTTRRKFRSGRYHAAGSADLCRRTRNTGRRNLRAMSLPNAIATVTKPTTCTLTA